MLKSTRSHFKSALPDEHPRGLCSNWSPATESLPAREVIVDTMFEPVTQNILRKLTWVKGSFRPIVEEELGAAPPGPELSVPYTKRQSNVKTERQEQKTFRA